MELLNNPQIHSTFASLGSMQGNSYVVNANCMSILEEISSKLAMEDHTLRTYRRAIGFGQNVKKDILPLLINVKDPQIIDCAVRLLVNLTVPIEYLLSVDVMSRTEIGRHTISELNRLLFTSKEVFFEIKATKAIIDHMKCILETDHNLSINQCESVNSCLLLLRNILHIPEHVNSAHTSMQNQILWNLFTQSIDKLLIYLMSCPQKSFWGVTIVQLIALMYKDQHVGTLQKLLNHWFEAASHTDSSDDNESNTSPPKQNCSGDSSPMLTSDPTSDSSDNGSGKMITNSDVTNPNVNPEYQTNLIRVKPKPTTSQKSTDSMQSTTSGGSMEFDNNQVIVMKSPEPSSTSLSSSYLWSQKPRNQSNNNQKHSNKSKKSSSGKSSNNQSELSDCGYGTQASQGEYQSDKKRESISTTSSNDDDCPLQKPAHQKPPSTNQKQRFNAAQKQRQASISNSPVVTQEKKDARRKKLVKRSKSSIINMKGLIHHSPSDEDISNILKEFTVDFLLKGYGFLVQELHTKLLTDFQLSIDTSHFFWLVTYFLKFAAQLELDLEHIHSVLSFDIVSYLTFEGVSLCEQLELTSRQQGTDLKPYLRRIHLVVTAIREFLQALEVYKKSSYLSPEDKEHINKLQLQIGGAEDLRQLFVLLLRCYNPQLQSHQYLQDLVVTNHILLLLLDNVSKQSETKNSIRMAEHIKQFATVDIMHQYGVLLEDFRDNGEFVNDCIFTMMHHVGGDLNQVAILFQPKILKTYSQIWEAEHEICDDWSDLIEYVIHKFINTPPKPQIALASPVSSDDVSINDIWAQEEIDTLYWYYVQNKKRKDVVGNIIDQIKDSAHKIKSRIAVIHQLLQQDIVTLVEYDDLMKFEDSQYEREVKSSLGDSLKEESGIEMSNESENSVASPPDDITVLRDRLLKENKGKLVMWLQQILIECCFVKLNMQNKSEATEEGKLSKHVMESIPYHCILKKQSIPLVPYNAEQNKILIYQPFVLLLHKLGFHLPADANKLFVRIPEFWTADMMFNVAERLGPIKKSNLKFNISLFRKLDDAPLHADEDTMESPHDSGNDSSFLGAQTLRSSNHLIRYTPEAAPDSQNWLQLVMQSKATASESVVTSHLTEPILTPAALKASQSPGFMFVQPSPPHRKPLNLDHDDISDVTISSNNYESVETTEVHEHDANVDSCETNSVASSSTRMYVSDEEVETLS